MWLLVAALVAALADGATEPPYNATKAVFKIGGLAIRGAEDFNTRFSPTFADYLTREVGPLFNPPITFESVPLNFSSTFSAVEHAWIDFVYTNPTAFSCLDSEFGVSAITTLRNLRNGIELTQFGGIVFTRANNTEITQLRDLEDKIVEAVSISGLGAAQMQWRLMIENGMNLMVEPKQVRFAFNQKEIVHDVRRGDADVGFVRTGMIEGMEANNETKLEYFKVINKVNATVGGDSPFPFQISTSLYPEWCLGALAHVQDQDYKVAEEVSKALMNINSTMAAAIAAGYSTWQAPLSYMPLREMQEALGWIQLDATTQKWRCMRSDDLYEAIVCPSGYFKLTRTEVENQCNNLNDDMYRCPEGYECLCRPCKRANEVEIKSAQVESCEKMGVCVEAEQNELFKLDIKDNLERNQTLFYKFHVPESHPEVRIQNNIDPIYSSYNLTLGTPVVGDNVLEITIGGQQIPNSPVLIRIKEKDCGEHQVANQDGTCRQTKEVEYLPAGFRIASILLFAFNVTLSLVFFAWTFYYRRHPIIMASQPTFLYMVACGCILSSSTILLVSFDDKHFSSEELDIICQGSVWFYGLGFALTISALFAKTYRAKCLTIDKINSTKSQHVVVSIYQYMIYVAAALTVEIIICTIWTIYDPLKWTRSCATDTSGYCRSIGTCSADSAVIFISLILTLHFIFLVYMLWICYEVRNIPAEFAEHKWITASTVSSIEILFLTPFLVYMTFNNPTTSTLIMALALFFNDLGVLVMIFVPKFFMMFQEHTAESESQENMLFNLRRKVREKLGRSPPVTIESKKAAAESSLNKEIGLQSRRFPSGSKRDLKKRSDSKENVPEIQICQTPKGSNPVSSVSAKETTRSSFMTAFKTVAGTTIREQEEAGKVSSDVASEVVV